VLKRDFFDTDFEIVARTGVAIDYIMHKSKEKAMEYRVKILDLEPLSIISSN
jgi:shikimate kinase